MSHIRSSSEAYEYWREGLLINISNGAPFIERGRPGNVVSLLLISEGGSLVVGNPLPTPPPWLVAALFPWYSTAKVFSFITSKHNSPI
jgi:hypothetical protein